MRRILDGGILPHRGEQPAAIARRIGWPARAARLAARDRPVTRVVARKRQSGAGAGTDAALWSNTGLSTKP